MPLILFALTKGFLITNFPRRELVIADCLDKEV
jgi:hypothetical protein